MLIKAIDAVQNGRPAPGLADSTLAAMLTRMDTVDGIAAASDWENWWQTEALRKRAFAPWLQPSK